MVKISDYFRIVRGNATHLSTRLDSHDKEAVRLISSTSQNNGGNKMVFPETEETIYDHVITINNNGSIGYVFWHPYKFIASSDVTIIQLRSGTLNTYTALYLKTAIELQKNKFAYGYKISDDRLQNLMINVPITKNHHLDFKAMETVIKSKFSDLPVTKETKNSIEKSLSLMDINWKQFTVKEVLGTPLSGNDLPKYLRTEGTTPFVGSSASNNGLTGFIKKGDYTPKKYATNSISINRNGSVGYAFYHPYEAYFSGDTRYLKLSKNKNITPAIAIFITVAISQQKTQFGYGFKLGTKRLNNLIINLPVDKNGSPNWKFMDKYINSLPNSDLI